MMKIGAGLNASVLDACAAGMPAGLGDTDVVVLSIVAGLGFTVPRRQSLPATLLSSHLPAQLPRVPRPGYRSGNTGVRASGRTVLRLGTGNSCRCGRLIAAGLGRNIRQRRGSVPGRVCTGARYAGAGAWTPVLREVPDRRAVIHGADFGGVQARVYPLHVLGRAGLDHASILGRTLGYYRTHVLHRLLHMWICFRWLG